MKKFIILGNQNAIGCRGVFRHIKERELWLGTKKQGSMEFQLPKHSPLLSSGGRIDEHGNKFVKLGSVCWWTNIEHGVIPPPLELTQTYDPARYPKYDNYDAIEVSRVSNIPKDYDGVMGVPITFLYKHDPEQFTLIGYFNDGKQGEELGATKTDAIKSGKPVKRNGPVINKKIIYSRLLIKKK